MRGWSLLGCALWLALSATAGAYTANKVHFIFRDNGTYRVLVQYTVPELKEFREAYADFEKKSDAEKFYFALARGADFYVPRAGTIRFADPPQQPDPW